MKVERKFSILELSFSNIESTIREKRQSIENCYQKNVDEIEEKFSKENLEFHTDALNQSREKMLKQIWDDRNGLLETVNSSWETIRVSRVNAQNELNRVSRELKDKYSSLCLNKARFLDFRIGSLFKFKFTRPFELNKLVRYSNFIIQDRYFDLNLHDRQNFNYDLDYVRFYEVKVLNKYLIVFLMQDKKAPSSEFFLISEDGNEVHSKRFIKYWVYSAGASNSYIFVSCKDFKNKKRFNIHVYDFKFNLLKSYSLSKRYSTKFILGNDGLAFMKNNNIDDTLFFNTDNFKFIPFRKWIQKSDACFDKAYKLVHFNESYFYLLNPEISKMRIYKRNGQRHASITFDEDVTENMLEFDNDGNIYFNNCDFVQIYSSNGKFVDIFSIEETTYVFSFDQMDSLEVFNYDFWQKNLMDFLSTNV